MAIKSRPWMAVVLIAALSACAEAPLPPLNFSAPNIGPSAVKLDAELRSLTVSMARPDEQTGQLNQSFIEGNLVDTGTGLAIIAAWRTALQEALDRMVIFNDTSNKRVSLAIKILALETTLPPIVDATTRASARYEIIDRLNGDIIFTTDVNTTNTVLFSDNLYGIARSRESVNRAVQANILQFLQALETVDLSKPMFPAGPLKPARKN